MSGLFARRLRCGYGERTVLQGVQLEVRPGEVLALVGPNGAGKTTLLRALARLLRPRGGAVLLEGQDAWSLGPRAFARRVALAPQALSGTEWPLTVEEAVALGRAPHRGWFLPLSPQDRRAVAQVLEDLGLTHLRTRPLTALSGGELRRVVLARALAQEPRYLLLDEPTAYLDLRGQAEVLARLQGLAHRQGLGVAVTLHDLNQAALCADRVALLSGGQVVAEGTPEEVFQPDLLARVYGVPVGVARHPFYPTPLVVPLLPNGHAPLASPGAQGV